MPIEPPARLQIVPVDGRPMQCHVLDASPTPATALDLPLLFLHGLGCSAEAWKMALQCLAQRGVARPVFVPDMPGFGCSPGSSEIMGMEYLADWAVRLLDALGVSKVHVAGNLMGGRSPWPSPGGTRSG